MPSSLVVTTTGIRRVIAGIDSARTVRAGIRREVAGVGIPGIAVAGVHKAGCNDIGFRREVARVRPAISGVPKRCGATPPLVRTSHSE